MAAKYIEVLSGNTSAHCTWITIRNVLSCLSNAPAVQFQPVFEATESIGKGALSFSKPNLFSVTNLFASNWLCDSSRVYGHPAILVCYYSYGYLFFYWIIYLSVLFISLLIYFEFFFNPIVLRFLLSCPDLKSIAVIASSK